MSKITNNSNVPSVGSHDDIYNRIVYQQLPPWFGNIHPDLDAVLEAFINTLLFNYSQYEYVALQQRLQNLTENNLDLFSQDYFGGLLPRRTDESDDNFRNRISANLLQEKATRFGMQNALFILTGIEPKLYEPWNPLDNACYNVPSLGGYSTFGSYGSGSYPYQGFIDVYVNAFEGMANYGGYNSNVLAYNTLDPQAFNWYGGDSLNTDIVSDADIYQTINLTKPEGTVSWVRINRNYLLP